MEHVCGARRVRRSWGRSIAVLLALVFVAGACASSDDPSDTDGDTADVADADLTPQRGGSLRFGLSAETTGGYCIPEAQLAASGITVAKAVYETLLTPSADGGDPEPLLAESYEANDDSTEFTFRIRDGVTFHDGTALDAEAVALTLRLNRGEEEAIARTGRTILLSPLVYTPVESIDVVDPMTVRVVMNEPWPTYPHFLASARGGIAAPAQLSSENCAEELIGTGPFELDTWRRNEEMVLTRNDDYWRTDADGEQLPYLDELVFVPIPSGPNRIQALEGGSIDAAMFDEAREIDEVVGRPDDYVVTTERPGTREVRYAILNGGRAPLDDVEVRRHLAMAIDRGAINDIVNDGSFELADQPFDADVLGHDEGLSLPAYDPEAAADFFDGKDLTLQLSYPTGAAYKAQADEMRRQLAAVGVDLETDEKDEASVINQALSGDYDLLFWRNHPGTDPDVEHFWWREDSPVNFGKIADAELDRLMDAGRQETDRDERDALYRQVSEIFADEVYNLWLVWAEWAYAGRAGVHQLGRWTQVDGSPSADMRWGWSHWTEVWVEQ